jgi:hypothetical protein
MAEHTIVVRLMGIHAVPDLPKSGEIRVGDFVTYTSPDGNLEVLFSENGSPFNVVSLRGGERREAIAAGVFTCKCFITHGTVTLGWNAVTSPQSGGDHDVRP